MATFRLVFRVSKVQQYSDNYVQDLLRTGLSTALHKKPLEVPEFGQISAIVLLGSKNILSSVDCVSVALQVNVCSGTDRRSP